MNELDELTLEVARLRKENEGLRSTMIAAAEEIDAHWDAHCDEDGYGPVNLMNRLERGIPAMYAYKAGDFVKLSDQLAAANIELRYRGTLIAMALESLREAVSTQPADSNWAINARHVIEKLEDVE